MPRWGLNAIRARLGDKASSRRRCARVSRLSAPAVGPIVTARRRLRQQQARGAAGRSGIHAVCCGPNTFTIQRGSPTVYVNGQALRAMNDQTKHCGASGPIIEAPPTVNIDDGAGAQDSDPTAMNALQICGRALRRRRSPSSESGAITHGYRGQQQNLATTPSQASGEAARVVPAARRKDQEVPSGSSAPRT